MENTRWRFASRSLISILALAIWTSSAGASSFIGSFSTVSSVNVDSQGNGPVVNAGTVVRLILSVPMQRAGLPAVTESTTIGSGFSEQANGAALIVGPTGLGFNAQTGTLYVADTLNNRIAAIPGALVRTSTAFAGKDVTSNGGLNQPLGMVIAPNGDIVTVNAADGNIVETTPQGTQFPPFTLIGSGGGDLFGLAIVPGDTGIYFVNDGNNSLMLFN
jgi:DNA-binding beta-propeller fold protein YncE